MNWFYKLLGFKEKELPAPGYEEPIWVQPTPPKPLSDVFIDTIQETFSEQYKLEQELLNDDKLRDYIKNVVRAMVVGLNKDSYDFILIHPSDAKIDGRIWQPFSDIMVRLFKEIDLPCVNEATYLNVKKKDVRKAFAGLKRQVVDIDERTRAMLSQGIYR